MRIIDAKQIHSQLNKCYLDYDPNWNISFDNSRVDEFKYYLEQKCGLKLNCVPATDNLGRVGFEIKQVEIVNDPKFTMWLVRWT